jgi:hypothetical protein
MMWLMCGGMTTRVSFNPMGSTSSWIYCISSFCYLLFSDFLWTTVSGECKEPKAKLISNCRT